MSGIRFADIKDIKISKTKELQVIPEKFSLECMEAWERRMAKCTRSQWIILEAT